MTAERLPRQLTGQWEILACLKDVPGRQCLLTEDRTGRQAVLKWSPDGGEDLEEAARMVGRMDCPDLPVIYASGREDGASWLLREYIPGETLLDYAQKKGPLSAEETARIGLALCRVLKELHRQDPPVIHRDVKAENIIRTPEGRYLLIDFGIARRYDSEARRDTRVLGTPASAPPEQFGYRQTDPRSDVYAVGVLLHQLSTGETSLEQGRPPQSLAGVIARCTRFDPEKRFPDAAALERALKRTAAGGRKWPGHWLAGLLAVALLSGVLLWAGWGREQGALSGPEPPARQPYEFASAALEAEVCRQLGKEPGTVTLEDLGAVERILLCGTEPFERWEQLTTYGQSIQLDGNEVNSRGGVDTLADIPMFPNLRELALCNQAVSDLSPLAGCGVERLCLHGNQISDLTALGGCAGLRELDISGNPLEDLGALERCDMLWKLNAGGTGLERLDSLAALPSLGTLLLHDCPRLTDISALAGMRALNTLQIRPVTGQQLKVIGGLTELSCLGLWQAEGMEDLTPISGLTRLTWLFVHTDGLAGAAGIEEMRELGFLDLRSAQSVDLRPLAGLPALKVMNVVGLTPESWEPLAGLPALEWVGCLPEQEEAIREALAGRTVEIQAG